VPSASRGPAHHVQQFIGHGVGHRVHPSSPAATSAIGTADLYRRLVHPVERIHYQRLPSTSPAHAVRPGAKLAAWRAISASIASAAQPDEAGRRQ